MPLHVSEAEYRRLTREPERVERRVERHERHEPKTVHVVQKHPDLGYWAYISGAIFLLFVFYIAGKGELKQWIDVLVWAPAKAPKSTGPKQEAGGLPEPGQIGGAMTKPGGAAAPFQGPFFPPGNIVSQAPQILGGVVPDFIKGWLGAPTGQRFFGGGPPV